MRLKIILEVDADEIEWGKSSVEPVDCEAWGQQYDVDIDVVKYQGERVEFVDSDKAADHLIFLYGEAS